jgi:hypothetical protein
MHNEQAREIALKTETEKRRKKVQDEDLFKGTESRTWAFSASRAIFSQANKWRI